MNQLKEEEPERDVDGKSDAQMITECDGWGRKNDISMNGTRFDRDRSVLPLVYLLASK